MARIYRVIHKGDSGGVLVGNRAVVVDPTGRFAERLGPVALAVAVENPPASSVTLIFLAIWIRSRFLRLRLHLPHGFSAVMPTNSSRASTSAFILSDIANSSTLPSAVRVRRLRKMPRRCNT
jgi:hypothetical protein